MKDAQGSLKDSSFQITANRMAAEGLTLVKNETSFFPLKLAKQEKLYIIDLYDHENDHSESITTKALRNLGANVRSFQLDESDKKYVANAVLAEIPKESTVIINAFVSPLSHKNRITLPEYQEKFIQSLSKKTKGLLLNSYGSPYLIEDFPMVDNYICSWKESSIMQNAFVRALTGRENISGKLPITIPGVAERNFGIPIRKKPIWFVQEPARESGKKLMWVLPAEAKADVSALELLLDQAIADSAWPGNVLLAAREGQVFYHDASGFHTYSKRRRMSPSDIFDLASISKAVSTTSAVMLLVEQNKISLDTQIKKIIPQFSQKKDDSSSAREKITVKHLLTHTAGFPAFKQYYLMDIEAADILADICNTELVYDPGTKTIYSDLGLILLGAVIESVAGMPLDTFVAKHLFEPLGMSTSFYNPPDDKRKRIVPTEIVSGYRSGLIHGEVHDENAHKLGGVAGHAGLFSTASELARFAQMMLNNGQYGKKRIFKEKTVRQFTQRAMVDTSSSRCLGWDSPSGNASGGVYQSGNSYGHTGYTGTSLWIDPDHDLFVILLTNAVHPDRSYKDPTYFDWRQRIHSAVYESLGITKQNPKLTWRKQW
jgi:CubicO group peptidase (beta-lactamase class C family)